MGYNIIMSQEDNYVPDRLVRLQTAKTMRHHEGIRNALGWYRENPQGLYTRIEEFDSVLTTLNQRMGENNLDSSKYHHADKLQGMLGERKLPTIEDLYKLVQTKEDLTKSDFVLVDQIGKTFNKIDELIHGDWSYANKLSPQQTASALLIEGYGLMLEEFYNIEGLRGVIVEAVKEELVFNHKNGILLSDVLGWIEEEAEERFSPEIQAEITLV